MGEDGARARVERRRRVRLAGGRGAAGRECGGQDCEVYGGDEVSAQGVEQTGERLGVLVGRAGMNERGGPCSGPRAAPVAAGVSTTSLNINLNYFHVLSK